MKRKLLITLATAGLVLAGAFQAQAGWVKSGSDWTYVDEHNNKIYNEWRMGADNEWRWLGSNGVMAVNSFVDGEQYYVNENGLILTKTWKQVDNYWYYFDEKGKKVTAKWLKLNNKHYYFDEEGRMQTGWILDNLYYMNENGEMQTGWKQLYPYDEDRDNASSGPGGGDTEGGKKWFYFGSNGKKYFADASSSGYVEKKIDGKRYSFNEKGELMVGWVNVNPDAAPAIKAYRYFSEDGTVRTGWYSIEPPEELSAAYDDPVEWFYFDSKGEPKASSSNEYKTGDFVRINGKQYLFAENGTPVYGLQKIHTSTGYDTYDFGKASECYVQKGKRTIEDADGSSVYYFQDSSGKGVTGVKDAYLYYKGKLQKAEDDKYIIMSIPSESGTGHTNYVINKSGKVMKNTKVKNDDKVELKTNAQGVLSSIDGSTAEIGAVYTSPKEPSFN